MVAVQVGGPTVYCILANKITACRLVICFTKTILKLENTGSRIDMRTHAGTGRRSMRHLQPCNRFRNRVTLTFDLLTSGLMHAERLLYCMRVPSLVLIVQAVFLLQRGQTDIQTNTRLNAVTTPAAMPVWVISHTF